MPKGVYERTKPITKKQRIARCESARKMSKLPKTKAQLEALSRGRKKGREISASLPRTQKQIDALSKGRKLPATQKQRETWRKIGHNNKGRLNPHGPIVFGDDIVKHHNDLCRGKLRPEDITLMTNSEHWSLHNKLRVEDGTHPFLAKNR